MKVDKSVRCGVLRPVPEGRVELPSRGKQLLESPWQWLADKKKVCTNSSLRIVIFSRYTSHTRLLVFIEFTLFMWVLVVDVAFGQPFLLE